MTMSENVPQQPEVADSKVPRHREQRILLVAYCNGSRCAGLRRLHANPSAAGLPAPAPLHCRSDDRASSILEPLHRAVRQRPHSLLLSTDCLGSCAQGPMAALGWGLLTPAGAKWIHRPIGVGLIDRPGRAAELGHWIATTAPELESAPSLWPRPTK